MPKRRKGFLTHDEALKFLAGMTPAQRAAYQRGVENARLNKKRKVKYDIDPFTGQWVLDLTRGE